MNVAKIATFLYNRRLYADIQLASKIQFDSFDNLLLFEAIKKTQLTTEYFSGEWHDIGTPKRLDELNEFLVKNA